MTKLARATLAASAAMIWSCACSQASAMPPITGIARALDGDSLEVGSKRIRLFAIDAPEWEQNCKRNGKLWACGQEAATKLSGLVTGRQVTCFIVNTDEHERAVSRCSVGSTDVNETMVSSGYAVAYRHFSLNYVAAEASAKAAKRGLWGSDFQLPRDYRRFRDEPAQPQTSGRRRAPEASENLPGRGRANCNIKGNRGSNGWIYHVPGMPYYDRTRPEDIFCSEEEARAAGYRRAR